jgi:outer membrane protein OmpA-like peptidoglycan-associated protein
MTTLKFPALAMTAGLFVLSACTDINTSTGSSNTRTNEGIGVGAATGALIGILQGDDARDRRRGAVVGAILGGAVGGAIGSNLDKQAADLQATLGDDRIQIINTGSELIVRMPQDILFAVDSTVLLGALRSDLAALADNIRRFPGSTIDVFGHTDNTGTAAYNRDLSTRRANSVSAVLIANGVSGSRIRSIGRGEDDPIASNLTVAGRAQNRRVEIVIRPNS